MKKFRYFAAFATIFFAINALMPLMAFGQSSYVGEHIKANPNDFGIDYVGPDALIFPAVKITSPRGNYNSYHYTTYKDDNRIQVHDGRYNGGFVVQVQISDYTNTENPSKKIPVSNIAIVTEPGPSAGYSENLTQLNSFNPKSGTLLANSSGNAIETEQKLPFDFVYYGAVYDRIFICTSGYISFVPAGCSADQDPLTARSGAPRIVPYFKDLTTNTKFAKNSGIYFEDDSKDPDLKKRSVRIRWKAATSASPHQSVEFEVVLYKDNHFEFEYGDTARLADTGAGPEIGLAGPNVTVNDTTTGLKKDNKKALLSGLNKKSQGKELSSLSAVYASGVTTNEVTKQGTPSILAPLNGVANNGNTYTNFIDEQTPLNALYAPACSVTQGRVGTYLFYASYKLHIPPTTPAGSYSSTITWTIIDESLSC